VPFNGDRLRILRRFHNLTQRSLGELVGSPASAITAYERGMRDPKGDVLDALAVGLRVDKAFFSQPTIDDEFTEGQANFRSLLSTPDRLRKKILAHATLFGTLVEYLDKVVKVPSLSMPKVSVSDSGDIEKAAEQCRVEWGVGVDTPIGNMTRMMELAGVIVVVLDESVSKEVDAFSRYGTTNLIVLNPSKGSATRTRFDIAHEAGHGVLHRGLDAGPHNLREEQASYFAGALLLPKQAFGREFWGLGRSTSWEHLLDLKLRWKVSMPALVTRAYQLGLIDAADYRRRYKYMARQGWLRGQEPGEPVGESPELFSLIFQRFLQETGKSVAMIAQDLGWASDLFEKIVGLKVESADDPSIHSLAAARLKKFAMG
jgi:Zn-dependent peptidase ImmA (M78 family)/transcriptional regulator with XRE-family HTH domain